MKPSDVDDRIYWETEDTEWQQWDGPWDYEGKSRDELKTQLEDLKATWIERIAHPVEQDPMLSLEICVDDETQTHIGWLGAYYIDDDCCIVDDGKRLAVGITKKHYLHFMCKKELMSVPIVGWWIRRVGSFAVDRSGGDINAIRTAMRLLKSGEKVMIFPEGTRTDTDDAVSAKTGAIRLAARLHVPIVPVYIPREKKLFRKVVVRVGEPYYVDCSTGDHEAFTAEADALMERISALHREEKA